MNILFIFGSLFGALIRIYPLTRLSRYLLFKMNVSNNQNIIITSVVVLLIDVFLWVNIDLMAATEFFIYELIGLGIIAYVDYSRDKKTKLIRVLYNMAFRFVVGAITFVIILSLLMNWLPLIGIIDPYFITPLIVSSLYVYFVFRKKKHQKIEFTESDNEGFKGMFM
jgi:hypothetical protein